MDTPEHIEISVAAVGGIESDAGQEMYQILTERYDDKSKVITERIVEQIEHKEESVLGAELEGMFAKAVKKQ